MSTIYIVMGDTGAYSDAYEWAVCAYAKKEDAQAHAEVAEAEAKRIFEICEQTHTYYDREGVANPYDPEMSMDYNGTHYRVWEVELREQFVP